MCGMDQCCIACYTVCSFFLSLPLSFWQRLIGTSCKRLRREREHLKAGKQSIVECFCGVCVVKLCRWCCAVPSSISCPRQGWVGLGWVGLGWVGLGWVGLGWVGLGCVVLNYGVNLHLCE